MIDLDKFFQCLHQNGIDFFTGVPDSYLNDFCLHVVNETNPDKQVITANEGNAIALAAGYHLATGNVPLVYMQNSGIGNAMNPLLSLTNQDVYSIPMVLLIGWRGDPELKDHAQHLKQGVLTPMLMDSLDIPYKILDEEGETAFANVQWAATTTRELNRPTALLVKKGILSKEDKQEALSDASELQMTREEAIANILKNVPKDSLFVATTGRATRELHEQRNLEGNDHAMDFLNVGAMGHALSIANGLALGTPKRKVVCLDGDASVIMHMGSLATTGMVGSSNLIHIVLNNGVHESVGGQPSAGHRLNLTAIAANSGYRTIGSHVDTSESLRQTLTTLLEGDGPVFIDVHIRIGIRPDLPPLKIDHLNLKTQLMENIKGLAT